MSSPVIVPVRCLRAVKKVESSRVVNRDHRVEVQPDRSPMRPTAHPHLGRPPHPLPLPTCGSMCIILASLPHTPIDKHAGIRCGAQHMRSRGWCEYNHAEPSEWEHLMCGYTSGS